VKLIFSVTLLRRRSPPGYRGRRARRHKGEREDEGSDQRDVTDFHRRKGKYGTPLVEAEYRLEAAAADPVAAEALQVLQG
jgi:hypothetical protein